MWLDCRLMVMEVCERRQGRRTGRGRGGACPPPTLESEGAAPPPPPTFLQMIFLHANARHSKPKVANRCRHVAYYKFDIAFDLFNIFLYVIARKVRKCPLSPFVTSNVVLSCLVQMADSLCALQLTGALFRTRWGKNYSFSATTLYK